MPSVKITPTSLEEAMLPLMEKSEVIDQLETMKIQEETTYIIRDYLADSVQIRKAASKPVDEDCRVKMCEWCYQVVDFCKFRRETVAIGMSYLDRYLCTLKGRDALCNRKEYQLVAMTALYIAIKMHEPLEMETSLLAELSRGCYDEMEFVHMEQKILLTLNWRVNGPTALGFVQLYLALMPSSVHHAVKWVIMDYARFQIELAISDHKFVAMRPSELAFAAILNAMEGMDKTILPLKTQARFIRSMEKYSEIYSDELEGTQAQLSMLLLDLMGGDYSDLVSPSIEEEEEAEEQEEGSVDESCKPGILNRRDSPVSVIRR